MEICGSLLNYYMKLSEVKIEFKKLCDKAGLPAPHIIESVDFLHHTDSDELHIVLDEEMDLKEIRHLFGHYICNLHFKDDYMADEVADSIARLVTT